MRHFCSFLRWKQTLCNTESQCHICGHAHQNHKPSEFPFSHQVTEKKANIQLKGSISNLYDQNFITKRWWDGKSSDPKLPVEIGNKLQLINQIKKKKNGNLSADNSQVKKVHYKWLALLQIFSSVCVHYFIKLLPLTYFKGMPLLTGTSVGSQGTARKQTLSLCQMQGCQKFQEVRRFQNSFPP